MPTVDEEIRYIVKTYGTEQAAASFKKIDQELSKTSVTASGKLSPALQNVSRRDLGIFASQVIMASGVTGRLTNQLSNLATGLATGGAIGAAFAGGAAIVGLLTDEVNKLKTSLEQMTKELLKVEARKGAFNIPEENLQAAINTIKSRIEILKLSTGRATFGGAIIEVQTEEIRNLEHAKGLLEDANKKYHDKLSIIKLLTDAGLTFTEELKKETEELEKQAKLRLQISDAVAFNAFRNRGFNLGPAALRPPSGLITGNEPGLDIFQQVTQDAEAERQRQIQEELKKTQAFIATTVGVLENEFNQAWENIFGEANSLFEKLIANWASMLASDIFSGLLSFLPGGGGVLGFLGSLFGSPAGGGTGTSNRPIILQFDDGSKMEFVSDAMGQMQRRRMV